MFLAPTSRGAALIGEPLVRRLSWAYGLAAVTILACLAFRDRAPLIDEAVRSGVVGGAFAGFVLAAAGAIATDVMLRVRIAGEAAGDAARGRRSRSSRRSPSLQAWPHGDAIGAERLTLPETTLNATVARMRSQRETIAVQRTAEGQRRAAEICADAQRASRVAIAAATVKAADIEAAARREAADIYAKAYQSDPRLYLLLRSLDTLAQVTGPNTRILLRADAAPFDLLVQGPPHDDGAAPHPATAASGASGR